MRNTSKSYTESYTESYTVWVLSHWSGLVILLWCWDAINLTFLRESRIYFTLEERRVSGGSVCLLVAGNNVISFVKIYLNIHTKITYRFFHNLKSFLRYNSIYFFHRGRNSLLLPPNPLMEKSLKGRQNHQLLALTSLRRGCGDYCSCRQYMCDTFVCGFFRFLTSLGYGVLDL